MELAKRMIRLSGLTLRDELRPDGDIAIEVTGLRPGEKLYEELLIGMMLEVQNIPGSWWRKNAGSLVKAASLAGLAG